MRRGGTLISVLGVVVILGGMAVPQARHARRTQKSLQRLVTRREQNVQEARLGFQRSPKDWSANYDFAFRLVLLREVYTLQSTNGERARPDADQDALSAELQQVLDQANVLAATPDQLARTERLQQRAFGPDYSVH
jgi:Tfp pilus assembly protein PilV